MSNARHATAQAMEWFTGRPDTELIDENARLVAENARLRAQAAAREEDAYRHGLGDRERVYDENQILAATIAALTDRQHRYRINQ